MFTYEDRRIAVNLYYKYHGNGAAVITELGYPSGNALRQWVKEDIEVYMSRPIAKSSKEEYIDSEKKESVIDLMVRDKSAKKLRMITELLL